MSGKQERLGKDTCSAVVVPRRLGVFFLVGGSFLPDSMRKLADGDRHRPMIDYVVRSCIRGARPKQSAPDLCKHKR